MRHNITTCFAGAGGTLLVCLFFFVSQGLMISGLAAATGDLDPSFGIDGIVNQDLGSNVNDIYQAVVIQSNNGRIVAAGSSSAMGTTDVVVARYMMDGSLDSSFGGTGIVYADIGGLADAANDLAIQRGGKIVVVGQSGGRLLVMRFNSDGTLDTSGFGSPNGYVTMTIGAGAVAQSVAIQDDNKIVVVGSFNNGSNEDIVLLRFDNSGALDFSVTTDLGKDEKGYAVALESDGKIVVGGSCGLVNNQSWESDFLVLRYTGTGALDGTFGSPNGYVTTDFQIGSTSMIDEASALGIQSDGKIVAAGESYSFLPHGAIARYNQDGSLDTSFSGDGTLMADFADYGTVIRDLAFQADGKIVVAADSYNEVEATIKFTVARVMTDGSMDSSFGTDGASRIDAGYYFGNDLAYGVAIQRDGNILAVGRGQFEIVGSLDLNQNALLMRFEGDAPFASAVAVPTLGEWGLTALVLLMALVGVALLTRRLG